MNMTHLHPENLTFGAYYRLRYKDSDTKEETVTEPMRFLEMRCDAKKRLVVTFQMKDGSCWWSHWRGLLDITEA